MYLNSKYHPFPIENQPIGVILIDRNSRIKFKVKAVRTEISTGHLERSWIFISEISGIRSDPKWIKNPSVEYRQNPDHIFQWPISSSTRLHNVFLINTKAVPRSNFLKFSIRLELLLWYRLSTVIVILNTVIGAKWLGMGVEEAWNDF